MARRLGNIRLVTFDLYDTLYTPRESVEKTYTAALQQHGIRVDLAKVQSGLAQAIKYMRQHYPNYGYGLMSSRAWWRQVIDRTWAQIGVPHSHLDNQNKLLTARESLIDHFNTSAGYRMFDDVTPTLKYLQRRGIRAGVVSNMDEAGEKVLCHLGVRSYFDFVLKSVTVGVQKPDSRIYEMALRAVNVPAYDALHVGDSRRMDFEPAVKIGMHARLVCRGPEAADLAARYPDQYISSLLDLTKII
ncbi:Haloacid dehalogenase-like hydrolase domain-containing protein 3 [Coemansia sp. RSA 2706]|nr:Haloacid dehalogenase-like hydrolase domain-containing protein 3 [Coemansia sp. RSA 2711]KAJ1839205.1 Haloacid dehalogenase-like hydrolase domain-containing protein 3 [Coemansia sp. RSA 2708]KAJ2295497.1 Haloacid dehalogenase-like hydrolase domain-containing protein 3 [Coemansia sp. RSA 2706]KAJ2311825.1 Haloacid dehalogenase-like hydrolase domain-containing protein 3 [Coemansia sp. RSA 2705]KAJ2324162.1 Haloacid dehalogenase-like hydrolase domain-containing protein 3 [Coemansia sp. RSA 2702